MMITTKVFRLSSEHVINNILITCKITNLLIVKCVQSPLMNAADKSIQSRTFKLPFFNKTETMRVLEESQKITSKTLKQLTDATTHINVLSGEQKC